MLRFNQKDIVNWSSFSGDNNPMHYSNIEYENPVQGMLIFVVIMRGLLATESHNVKTVTGIEMQFRKHVYTEKEHFLTFDAGKGKLKMSDLQGLDIVTGCLSFGEGALLSQYQRKEQVAEKLIITRAEINSYYTKFHSMINKEHDCRTFICALAFRKIIHCSTFLNFLNFHFPSLDDYLRETHTLQVSQSASWLTEPSVWYRVMNDPGNVTVFLSVCQPVNGEGRKYVRLFNYNCYLDGVLILQCRTTVITKYLKEEWGDDRSGDF